MLQTNLHNPNVERKMTFEEFENLSVALGTGAEGDKIEPKIIKRAF